MIKSFFHRFTKHFLGGGKSPWRKISYAQSGEDLIIKYIFDSLKIKPSYIDIGVHHPYKFNNTALFYELGCRGINVEPDPDLYGSFTLLREERGYKIEKIVEIQTDTITNVINKQFSGKFPDLLSIDIEGLEEIILKSIDYEKTTPKVICAESVTFSPTGQGRKQHHIIDFLESKGLYGLCGYQYQYDFC